MPTKEKERTVEKPTTEKQQTAVQENELQQEQKPTEQSANEERPATDRALRKERKKQQQAEKRKTKKPRRRTFPIWQRIIVVLVLSAFALLIGVMVGYGVLGNGNPTDALKWDTWQHIIDIVTKRK